MNKIQISHSLTPTSNQSLAWTSKSRRHTPFLLPMGMLVLSREAKELCLDSWVLAARALFHKALINMDAKYSVCTQRNNSTTTSRTAREKYIYFSLSQNSPKYESESSNVLSTNVNYKVCGTCSVCALGCNPDTRLSTCRRGTGSRFFMSEGNRSWM